MIEERLPPFDLPAEEAVIGSLLIDGEMMANVDAFLQPEDFFSEQNRLIYDICRRLFNRQVAINQITVAQELAHDNKLEIAGGASYLSHLVSIVPTSLHIEDYGQIVSRLSTMRRLISAANKISAIGYRADANVDDALVEAEDILFKVKERKERGDFVSIQDVLRDYFDETRQAEDAYERSRYLSTGFAAIDNLLIGMQRSNLIILAARTSMGKTSLALNIARNAALNEKACVALFSLEMSKQELVQRLLSAEARVPSQRVRLGNFTEDEQERIINASGELGKTEIYIDDSPMIKAMEMRAKSDSCSLPRAGYDRCGLPAACPHGRQVRNTCT
jgi:replicative DNA helicase